MKFLDYLADHIIAENLEFDHLTVVLPSIRAKKYLEKALISRVSKPCFAPKIITIDKWIMESSGLHFSDPTSLLFLLYEVHKNLVTADEDSSFDAFLSWGQTLLSDFDEIERYLVDPNQLFKNLRDIKELEHWNIGDGTELSPAQAKFLRFWEQLNQYYHQFQTLLKAKELAYPGMAFRKVAENVELVFSKDKERHFVFAGLNALSKAEMTIIKGLTKKGKAQIIQDSDAFYLNAPHHEAGHFQRKLLKFLELKKMPRVLNKMAEEEKIIDLIECTQPSSQVFVASTLLSKMSPSEMDETLLLLGDESLVAPMVKNLPQNIGKANITMGIELGNTSLKLWIDLLFSIQENFVRYKTKALYFKDLFKFWHHPLYQAINGQESLKKQQAKEQEILRKNKLFISEGFHDFESPLMKKVLTLIYTPWEGKWTKGLSVIQELNQLIYPQLDEQWTMEKAGLRSFFNSIQKLQATMEAGHPEMGIKTFMGILQKHYGKAKIAFEGNPLNGLQIMGLLETRLLDFNKLIALGVNEGKLPNDNPIQSLIPMDLRAAFELPTNREKQGLFAHHFYRLLHQSKNITLVYAAGKSDMGASEPSRYLHQLELEWSKLCPSVKLNRKTFSLPVKATVQDAIAVEKTDHMLSLVDTRFKKSMSASAINKFIACPLDFYYRYILNLGEEDSVEEELNPNSFGSIVHGVLEEMFLPFSSLNAKGEKNTNAKSLSAVDISEMEAKVPAAIERAFMEFYDNDRKAFMEGKNYLSYQMSIELSKKFLQNQKEAVAKSTVPINVQSLEQAFNAPIILTIQGEQKEFNLFGYIDRIDFVGDKLRVIDYKTGKVDATKMKITGTKKDTKLDMLVNTLRKGAGSHVLQLLVYATMIKHNFGYYPSQLSIISFINYPDEGFDFNGGDTTIEEWVTLFPEALSIVLNELYDKSIPFSHDSKALYCTYCT
jgi:ATP-dependent helicase/nuclease subunit B